MNPLTWHGWPRAEARKVHLQVYSPPSTIAAEVQGSRASTVPPMTLRFASCLPACQIRSIRCNNLKREGAHGWFASRNWIEKGIRTPAYHGNVFPDEHIAPQFIQLGSFIFDANKNIIMKEEVLANTATMETKLIFQGNNLHKGEKKQEIHWPLAGYFYWSRETMHMEIKGSPIRMRQLYLAIDY